MEIGGPDPSMEYEETHAVELQFVDAGFSRTPWPTSEKSEHETVACGISRIEWTPVTLSEEVPIKELFAEEEPVEETPGKTPEPRKENIGEQ
jgi:hypothetical protein